MSRYIYSLFLVVCVGACAHLPPAHLIEPNSNILTYDELMKDPGKYNEQQVYLKAFFVSVGSQKNIGKSQFLVYPGYEPNSFENCRRGDLGSIIMETNRVVRLRQHQNKPNNDQTFAEEMIVKGTFSSKPTTRWWGTEFTFEGSLEKAEIVSSSPSSKFCLGT